MTKKLLLFIFNTLCNSMAEPIAAPNPSKYSPINVLKDIGGQSLVKGHLLPPYSAPLRANVSAADAVR